MFFPAIATAAHICTGSNYQIGMSLPLKFRFDVAMSGLRYGAAAQISIQIYLLIMKMN